MKSGLKRELAIKQIFNIEPFTELTEDNIRAGLLKDAPKEYFSVYSDWINDVAKELGQNDLTIDQRKNVQSYLYDMIFDENTISGV